MFLLNSGELDGARWRLACLVKDDVQWGTVRYSDVKWGTVRYSSVQWRTVTYSEVQWRKVRYSEGQWRKVKYSDVQWGIVRYSDVRWDTVKYSEIQWSTMAYSEVQGRTVTCSEVQWRFQRKTFKFRVGDKKGKRCNELTAGLLCASCSLSIRNKPRQFSLVPSFLVAFYDRRREWFGF